MYLHDIFVRKDESPLTNPDGNPQAQPAAILAGSSALFAISVVLVVLRFWSRIQYRSSRGHFGLWWDDWMAAAALMFFVPAFALICAVFAPNSGRHIESFSYEQRAFGTTALTCFALFFMYSMFCARCSALLFYHRVFVTGNKDWYRWLLGVLQGYNLCVMITFMSLLPFNCRITDTPADQIRLNCLSPRNTWIASASASFSSDLFVALAPIHMISRLNLPDRLSRLMVAIPFACGIIVVGVSLGRLIVTIRRGFVLENDITFSGMDVIWWPIAEMSAALVGVCLPSIYGLIRNTLLVRKRSSSANSFATESGSGMLIEKSIAVGTQPTGHSPHLSIMPSQSPDSMERALPPSPPSLAPGMMSRYTPPTRATRPVPVPPNPIHELPCAGSGQSQTTVTSQGQQQRRNKRGAERGRMPKSIYYVPPQAINE